jgi:hypothetical protein
MSRARAARAVPSRSEDLEMIGHIGNPDMKMPGKGLNMSKLNPVTEAENLKIIILSRFDESLADIVHDGRDVRVSVLRVHRVRRTSNKRRIAECDLACREVRPGVGNFRKFDAPKTCRV